MSEMICVDITDEEQAIENTAIADYAWLPVRFLGEMDHIDWKDIWRREDYENEK